MLNAILSIVELVMTGSGDTGGGGYPRCSRQNLTRTGAELWLPRACLQASNAMVASTIVDVWGSISGMTRENQWMKDKAERAEVVLWQKIVSM